MRCTAVERKDFFTYLSADYLCAGVQNVLILPTQIPLS